MRGWLRSVVSVPLGLNTIDWFHVVGARVAPGAYLAEADGALLLLVVAAGIAGCLVARLVAGHRNRMHAGVFLVAMGVVDVMAVIGELAGRPLWFRGLVLGTLPLQVWAGCVLTRVLLRYTPGR